MSKEIFINTGTSFQQQYIARQPAIGTAPVTAQYDAQGNANSQSPFTYQSRNPFTYRNPVNSQTPYIANKQNPYPYIANSQTSYSANAQQPYPYPANAQQTYPYIAQARQPGTYQATGRTPFTYQRTGRTPYPYIANSQTPFTYPANAQQPYPYIANAQSPFTFQQRSPSITQSVGRNPFTYQHRTPVIYNAPARTPYIYTFTATGQVTTQPGGKVGSTRTLSGLGFSGLSSVFTHRGNGGLKLQWSSLNTDWTSCRIGQSSSSYSTLNRSGFYTTSNTHHTGASLQGAYSSPVYIGNWSTAYFALVG